LSYASISLAAYPEYDAQLVALRPRRSFAACSLSLLLLLLLALRRAARRSWPTMGPSHCKLALATACCFLAATLVVCLASRLVDLDHSAIDPSPPRAPSPSLTQRGLKVVALDDEEQPMAMAMAMAMAVAPRPSSWHSFQQGFLALEQSFVGA